MSEHALLLHLLAGTRALSPIESPHLGRFFEGALAQGGPFATKTSATAAVRLDTGESIAHEGRPPPMLRGSSVTNPDINLNIDLESPSQSSIPIPRPIVANVPSSNSQLYDGEVPRRVDTADQIKFIKDYFTGTKISARPLPRGSASNKNVTSASASKEYRLSTLFIIFLFPTY